MYHLQCTQLSIDETSMKFFGKTDGVSYYCIYTVYTLIALCTLVLPFLGHNYVSLHFEFVRLDLFVVQQRVIQGGAKRTDVFRSQITTLILKVKLGSI